MSQRLAAVLESIRADALAALVVEDGRWLAVVLGAAVSGLILWGLLARAARRSWVVAALRPAVALSAGLGGALWVAWKLDTRMLYFTAALLAMVWTLTLAVVVAHLLVWTVRRVTSPWSNIGTGAAPGACVDRKELHRRIGLEISRLQGEGERSLCVAAIGARGKRRTGRGIWAQAVHLALGHYAVHRTRDGTVIVAMPDATRSQLRRWISHFNAPETNGAVGWAVFPADGRNAEQLLESAVSSLWGAHGRVPGAVGARKRDPSVVRLNDRDMVTSEE